MPMPRPDRLSRPDCSVSTVLTASTSTVAANEPSTTSMMASGAFNAFQVVSGRSRSALRLRRATQAAKAAATGPVSLSEPMTAATMFSHASTPGIRTLHAAARPRARSTATVTAALCFSSSRETPACSRTRFPVEVHQAPPVPRRCGENAESGRPHG